MSGDDYDGRNPHGSAEVDARLSERQPMRDRPARNMLALIALLAFILLGIPSLIVWLASLLFG